MYTIIIPSEDARYTEYSMFVQLSFRVCIYINLLLLLYTQMRVVHFVKYTSRDKGFIETHFIFIARDLQIKHKSGRFGNSKKNILKWENNGIFIAPFGMKKKMHQIINVSSESMRVGSVQNVNTLVMCCVQPLSRKPCLYFSSHQRVFTIRSISDGFLHTNI